MTQRANRRTLAGIGALAMVSFIQLPPAATAEEGETVAAVWKTQQLPFVYQGYVSYSCEGLREKLDKILRSVGARAGIAMRVSGCGGFSGNTALQIVLQSPVVATPATVRELTTYDATHALVAHVRGESLPSEMGLPRFAAVWKRVSFERDSRMRLDPGDCELVDELRRQILPRLSVQIVRNFVHCASRYGNITRPGLTVLALVPVATDSSGLDP